MHEPGKNRVVRQRIGNEQRADGERAVAQLARVLRIVFRCLCPAGEGAEGGGDGFVADAEAAGDSVFRQAAD